MKKLIGYGLALVSLVAIAFGLVLWSSLDRIVQTAIEKIGSDVTGSSVHLADVSISPTSGVGVLRGLRVTNPGGFEDGDAFQFEEISMELDITTIASDPVIIKEIVVQNPIINYHLGGKGTNVGELKENAEGYAAEGDSTGSSPKFLIQNLYFRGGKISVSSALLGGKKVTTSLPDLHMQDIGSEEDGVNPAILAKRIVSTLTKQVTGSVAKLDLSGIGDGLGKGAEEVKDATKGAADTVKGLFKKGD
jgi:uncharacterized protein involved in outer membrane biogenesis